MDGPRFDALTRTLTASRRVTLKTGLGAALGVILTNRDGADVAADCKNVGQNCDRNSDCCTGAKCQGGNCRCKSGRDECSGKCFFLDSDERHCGACNATCAAGLFCCGGECVDLQRDRDHCAACDGACAAAEICLAGVCVPCPVGNEVCGDVCCPPFRACCAGSCVDELEFNPNHCGECGNRCPRICDRGPDGVLLCQATGCCSSGQCIDDFQSDRNNCGACGNACTVGESCCDGACIDTDVDRDNCGSCGAACPPRERCLRGGCKCGGRPSCGAGLTCCDGECLDNDEHCGA